MTSTATQPAAGRATSRGRPTALEEVVRQLEDLVTRELEPGSHLQSEADLAETYGVSRLTVREALKVLAGRGLVELGRGRKPIVREPDSSVLSGYLAVAMRRDPRAVFELHTIRQSLEVLSASEAARTAGRAALSAIENALEAMTRVAAREAGPEVWADDYNAADVAFHEALALASGNRMLAFVLEGMGDALSRSFALSFEGFFGQRRDVQESIARHRAVLDYVKAGDAKGATRAMTDLLRSAEVDLRNATSGMQ